MTGENLAMLVHESHNSDRRMQHIPYVIRQMAELVFCRAVQKSTLAQSLNTS